MVLVVKSVFCYSTLLLSRQKVYNILKNKVIPIRFVGQTWYTRRTNKNMDQD